MKKYNGMKIFGILCTSGDNMKTFRLLWKLGIA